MKQGKIILILTCNIVSDVNYERKNYFSYRQIYVHVYKNNTCVIDIRKHTCLDEDERNAIIYCLRKYYKALLKYEFDL